MSEKDDQENPHVEPEPAVWRDPMAPESTPEEPHDTPEDSFEGDVDTRGHLATGLFVGVIGVLLVMIYSFAIAA